MDGVSSNNLLKELFNTLVNNVLIQALEVLFEVLCLPGEPGGRLVWWLRGPVEWGRWESPRSVFSNPRLPVCNLVKPNLHYWMLYWTSKDVADPRGLPFLTSPHYCLLPVDIVTHSRNQPGEVCQVFPIWVTHLVINDAYYKLGVQTFRFFCHSLPSLCPQHSCKYAGHPERKRLNKQEIQTKTNQKVK